jgi:hypothetical protein
MSVTQVEFEALERFAYCSMMFHLKDRLRLPSFAPTLEVGYQYALRSAYTTFFQEELQRVVRHGPQNDSIRRALDAYRIGMQGLLRVFPARATRWAQLHQEGVLSLLEFRQNYIDDRDRPLGANIKFAVNKQFNNDFFHVVGCIDFLYFKEDAKSSRTAVAVMLTNTSDPIQDLTNLGGVRSGFVYHALRDTEVVGKETPIELMEISLAPEPKSAVLKRDGKTLEVFLEMAFRGVYSGMALPMADPEKCGHCPYSGICNAKLALIQPGSADAVLLHGQMREAGKGKSYYKELKK